MDMELAGRMLDAVAQIPAGSVSTYGDIAARAGSPSARLAGRVLSQLSDDETPWYRVLRSNGTPAPSVAERQLKLLAAEGVANSSGRIDMRKYRWKPA